MITMVVGIGTGMVVIIGVMLVMQVVAGVDPPAEPPASVFFSPRPRDRLFQPARYVKNRKTATAVAVPTYNRPLEIQLIPDQEILPPPRAVHGINNEV